MATFGPDPSDVSDLTGTNPSAWLVSQFSAPVSRYLLAVQSYYDLGTPQAGMLADGFDQDATTFVFWRNAVHADDQLRQRTVFALSQILVVSNGSGGLNGIFPQTGGYYLDVLNENAFGNYRDLLEAITYSPAMAEYLTYFGNQKGDPATGRMPDENYAREILQLFTIGLVELNPDGTPRLGADGRPIETYDNTDITGLAKVFTGLYDSRIDLERAPIPGRVPQIVAGVQTPLTIIAAEHSPEAKSFLGTTIPAGTSGDRSIALALDHIMAHPNVGPFVGRQLIQRFVTSHPSPEYIERVATAFDAGVFTLPDGTRVGDGRKGDLKATIAAVLFDPEVSMASALQDNTFGKVREPVLRLTHFMRAFDVDMRSPEYVRVLYDTSPTDVLAQHPYRSPSVFNFYRPGYVAPGTQSGELELTVPELQIVNASTTPGYINLLTYGALLGQRENFAAVRPVFTASGAPFDEARAGATFIADYSDEIALASDIPALVDHLDDLLLYGSMSETTRTQLISTLRTFPDDALRTQSDHERFVGVAVLLVMSSPDYLVQR